MNDSPCYKCPDRMRIVEEFGNCHNDHCPNGWNEWREKHQDELKSKYKYNEERAINWYRKWRRNED